MERFYELMFSIRIASLILKDFYPNETRQLLTDEPLEEISSFSSCSKFFNYNY